MFYCVYVGGVRRRTHYGKCGTGYNCRMSQGMYLQWRGKNGLVASAVVESPKYLSITPFLVSATPTDLGTRAYDSGAARKSFVQVG